MEKEKICINEQSIVTYAKLSYAFLIIILISMFLIAVISFKAQLSINETINKIAPVPEINRQILLEVKELQKQILIFEQQHIDLHNLK